MNKRRTLFGIFDLVLLLALAVMVERRGRRAGDS